MKTATNSKLKMAICITLMLAVSSPLVFAYPPDPDNAALLYYQAYLLYQQPDDTTGDMLVKLAKGKIEPNEKIKQYVENCRSAIHYATAAADMQHCNWGLKYSDGFSACFPHLAQARQLSWLIIADARILAAEGAYQQALDRCLTARKISQHVGDETLISFLVGVAIRKMADSCIQDILGQMPQDVETLTWLKNQLLTVPSRELSVKATLEIEQQIALETMYLENVEERIEMFSENIAGDIEELLQNADEDFFQRSRDYYKNHMACLQAVLSAPTPYEKTYVELKKLTEKSKEDAAEDTAAALTAAIAPAMCKVYGHQVRTQAWANAIRAAVDIYIINAKTGRLPDSLPAGLPRDLFSGENFEYKKTKEGFVLRCQGKDLEKDTIHQYEFKIPK